MKSKKVNALIPVKGGLGNQMFFIAFGEYLRERNFEIKYLWMEYLFSKNHNGIEIIKLVKIKVNFVEDVLIQFSLLINKSWFPILFKKILYRLLKLKYRYCKKIIQKNSYSYNEIPIKNDGKVFYFDGFWQNIRYLPEDNALLRNIFSFDSWGKKCNKNYKELVKKK